MIDSMHLIRSTYNFNITIMNTISNLNKNFLFLPKDSANVDDFFKNCFEYIKREKVVLFLTTSSTDLLPIIKDMSLTKEELKRLVIINLDNMDAFIQKLLELHEWAWIPALIVVDLIRIIDKLSDELELINTVQLALQDDNITEPIKPVPFLQQLALLVASLLGYHESIYRRLEKSSSSSRRSIITGDENIFSILILKEHSVHLPRHQIELLINLYYYANNAFDDTNELIETISLKD